MFAKIKRKYKTSGRPIQQKTQNAAIIYIKVQQKIMCAIYCLLVFGVKRPKYWCHILAEVLQKYLEYLQNFERCVQKPEDRNLKIAKKSSLQ